MTVPTNVESSIKLNVPVVCDVLISAITPSPLTSMSCSNLASAVNLDVPATTRALSKLALLTLIPTRPLFVVAILNTDMSLGNALSPPTKNALSTAVLSRSANCVCCKKSPVVLPLMNAVPTTSKLARGSVVRLSTNAFSYALCGALATVLIPNL